MLTNSFEIVHFVEMNIHTPQKVDIFIKKFVDTYQSFFPSMSGQTVDSASTTSDILHMNLL